MRRVRPKRNSPIAYSFRKVWKPTLEIIMATMKGLITPVKGLRSSKDEKYVVYDTFKLLMYM
jgi:hypothetical protein